MEWRQEQLGEALRIRCRAERIELPSRLDRITGAARSAFDKRFCELTASRLDARCVAALEGLVSNETEQVDFELLAELKADPGQVGLETTLREIRKLLALRALGLPTDLFADASDKLLCAWRSRAARCYPSDLREASRPMRLTLLAALSLERPAFGASIGPDERRALSPLFWTHINPYGRFQLDMDARLDLTATA